MRVAIPLRLLIHEGRVTRFFGIFAEFRVRRRCAQTQPQLISPSFTPDGSQHRIAFNNGVTEGGSANLKTGGSDEIRKLENCAGAERAGPRDHVCPLRPCRLRPLSTSATRR